MKLIIAGSRNIKSAQDILGTFLSEITELIGNGGLEEIVEGGCRGVDKDAAKFAAAYGISSRHFFPDWTRYGKAGGPIRNEQMAEYADALIAIWDGKSKGTFDMIKKADKHGLEMLIITVGKIKEI